MIAVFGREAGIADTSPILSTSDNPITEWRGVDSGASSPAALLPWRDETLPWRLETLPWDPASLHWFVLSLHWFVFSLHWDLSTSAWARQASALRGPLRHLGASKRCMGTASVCIDRPLAPPWRLEALPRHGKRLH
jgi:hypothetical protein